MRMHQIEVDEEIYEYLKDRAEKFVDTPNSVLRRELLDRRPGRVAGSPVAQIRAAGSLPTVPFGTPVALEQILQVTHLVTHGGKPRSAATQSVAQIHRVAQQTVLDKYTRQLSLTAAGFDRLLAQDGLRDLRQLLRHRFPGYDEVVSQFLSPGAAAIADGVKSE